MGVLSQLDAGKVVAYMHDHRAGYLRLWERYSYSGELPMQRGARNEGSWAYKKYLLDYRLPFLAFSHSLLFDSVGSVGV